MSHDVVVLSRQPQIRPWRVVPWDGTTLDAWQGEIDGSGVVIKFAGRTVNCRYNAANRHEILHSRIASTRVVGEASPVRSAHRTYGCKPAPPPSTRTVTTRRMTSNRCAWWPRVDAPGAWRFSTDVAQAWERAFDDARTPATRKVLLRSAMTLSPDKGGVFDTLLGLVRRGLGGSAGNGRQFMSWIHYQDFVAAVRWLIERHDVEGIVNVASPNPLPNAEFMRMLREACGMPFGLPASDWMLEIGAVFMRTETELVLKSRRVVPAKLLQHGFRFRFPDWDAAASDLCHQSKARRGVSRSAA
jgi:uncharacterized protein (TIGR01777 family)